MATPGSCRFPNLVWPGFSATTQEVLFLLLEEHKCHAKLIFQGAWAPLSPMLPGSQESYDSDISCSVHVCPCSATSISRPKETFSDSGIQAKQPFHPLSVCVCVCGVWCACEFACFACSCVSGTLIDRMCEWLLPQQNRILWTMNLRSAFLSDLRFFGRTRRSSILRTNIPTACKRKQLLLELSPRFILFMKQWKFLSKTKLGRRS